VIVRNGLPAIAETWLSTDPASSSLSRRIRAASRGLVAVADGREARRACASSSVHVRSPDGTAISLLLTGGRLTFGRGQGADLVVPGGRGLSRRAGEITALAGGAWVVNIGHTHALYVEGDDYHVRLPPAGSDGPIGGWLLARGTASVGSMAMTRQGIALRLSVTGDELPPAAAAGNGRGEGAEATVRPLVLSPDTKLYLVALLLCRPWLLNPGHADAPPTAPEIARTALELTRASHQLRRLERDPDFRARLVEQVNEHLKYLRKRIQASGLAGRGMRLTPSVMAEVLVSNDVLTRADLAVVGTPRWQSRQEDLWWRTGA
jgi:hypothetical protein